MSVTVRRDCKALSVEITWNKDVSFLKHHIVLLTTFCLRPLSVFIIVLYCGLPPSRWETGKSQKWWWCTLYLGEEVESDLVSVAVCGTVVCTVTSQEGGPGFNSQLHDDPAIEWKLVQGVTGHWDSFQSLKTKTKLWKRNITSVEEMSEQNPVGLKLNWEVNQLRWDLKTLLDVKVLFGKVNKLYTRGHDTPKTSLCLAANWHRSLPPQTAVSH